jgi:hypothetical protein
MKVLGRHRVSGQWCRRARIRAQKPRQQPLQQTPPAGLLVRKRVVDGDVEPGHRQRDAAINERHAEPLRQRRADLAPGGPIRSG